MKRSITTRLAGGAIAVLLMAISPAASGSRPALAASSGPGSPCASSPCATTNQTTQVVVGGTIAVTTGSSVVDFGNGSAVKPGPRPFTAQVGLLDLTDTLSTSGRWQVVVAATDMVRSPAPASCTAGPVKGGAGTGCIPWTDLRFNPGTTFSIGSCPGTSTTGMTAGAGGAFSAGSDSKPGTTLSPPVRVMSAPATDSGCFQQSGSTATLTLPAGIPNGTYQGTFQYTIIG